MHLTKLLALLTACLAVAPASGAVIRLHSLNNCRNAPVDRQCGGIGPGKCCYLRGGGHARSILFAHVKGRRIFAGNNQCANTIYQEVSPTKRRCLFNLGGNANSGRYRSPLARDCATTGDDCEGGVVEANQAVVFGTTTFDIASMTAEEEELMDALAANGTAVADWPEELQGFIVPGEEEDGDLGFVSATGD